MRTCILLRRSLIALDPIELAMEFRQKETDMPYSSIVHASSGSCWHALLDEMLKHGALSFEIRLRSEHQAHAARWAAIIDISSRCAFAVVHKSQPPRSPCFRG